MNGVCNGKTVWPHPFGRGQKVKYYYILIGTSISKIFILNCVCVLTNKRYEKYRTGVLFSCLGHTPGVGLGALGVKNLSVGI